MEVWNYVGNKSKPVEFYVMEDTMNKVWYKERPLLMLMNEDISISTYTERRHPDTNALLPPNRAKIHVTDTELYIEEWDT